MRVRGGGLEVNCILVWRFEVQSLGLRGVVLDIFWVDVECFKLFGSPIGGLEDGS